MTISTILLIAAAAVLVFIMYQVGRGAREAAHAQAALSPPNPEDQSRASVNEAQADEGTGRKRHGCC